MRVLAVGVALVALIVLGGVAEASAPPVGKLPAAKIVQQTVRHGTLVALALPAPKHGNVWRVARPFNAHVATEVEERTLKSSIVVVYRAKSPGRTSIVYALTAGEPSSRALQALRLELRVT
ncbi:MAG TPA: hypothetical protein VFA97_03835 [Gaiellaceae bacterium]|nr:hypothetical protein [Gaiellaceae bacterium]